MNPSASARLRTTSRTAPNHEAPATGSRQAGTDGTLHRPPKPSAAVEGLSDAMQPKQANPRLSLAPDAGHVHLRWTWSTREDVVRACTSPAGVPASRRRACSSGRETCLSDREGAVDPSRACEVENEILKRAAAYFAWENVLPKWFSRWSKNSPTTDSTSR